jgi:hypothetical protein
MVINMIDLALHHLSGLNNGVEDPQVTQRGEPQSVRLTLSTFLPTTNIEKTLGHAAASTSLACTMSRRAF